jgi:RNA polymerase-binding transcription factor DksA
MLINERAWIATYLLFGRKTMALFSYPKNAIQYMKGRTSFKKNMLNDQQRNEAKKKLLDQREELRTLLARFAQKDERVRDDFHARFPEYGSEDEDNAEEVATYSDELGIERTLEQLLNETDAALDAIEKGTYGICVVCKKPIEPARLAAMPSATQCVAHASRGS